MGEKVVVITGSPRLPLRAGGLTGRKLKLQTGCGIIRAARQNSQRQDDLIRQWGTGGFCHKEAGTPAKKVT